MGKGHGIRVYLPSQISKGFSFVGMRELIELSLKESAFLISVIVVIIAALIIQSYRTYDKFPVRAPFFRGLGEVLFYLYAVVLIPLSRHSLWAYFLGPSFETLLKYHRAIGLVTVIATGVHGFGMWISYATSSSVSPKATLQYAMQFDVDPDTNWSNLSGFIAFCFVLVGAIAANYYIRRKMFEVFYYTHIVCAIGVYVFAQLHMPQLVRYMIPAIIFIGVDMAFRYYQLFTFAVDASLTATTDFTKVQIDLRGPSNSTQLQKFLSAKAGQYFILTIPQLGWREAHPFSMSSAPPIVHSSSSISPAEVEMTDRKAVDRNSDSIVTFHIKDMGGEGRPGAWTHRLHSLANVTDVRARILLDGPFGGSYRSLPTHCSLILCCGGIGATPVMSVLKDLLRDRRTQGNRWIEVKKILLLWSCREITLFQDFQGVLTEASELFGKESVRLFSSVSNLPQLSDEESRRDVLIESGRPDFTKLFEPILESEANAYASVGVMVCGPIAMVESVRDTLRSKPSWVNCTSFYSEEFIF